MVDAPPRRTTTAGTTVPPPSPLEGAGVVRGSCHRRRTRGGEWDRIDDDGMPGGDDGMEAQREEEEPRAECDSHGEISELTHLAVKEEIVLYVLTIYRKRAERRQKQQRKQYHHHESS